MNKVEIYTDGSSRGNPGPGGWAFVAIYPNSTGEIRIDEVGGREIETTNNRMELQAVIEGIRFFDNYYPEHSIVEYMIHLDSAYVLNGATKWLSGWQAKNWKTADRGEVKNVDLWQKMAVIINGKKITWDLLPGHQGIYGNERCDVIATNFADSNKIDLYSGPIAGYDGAEEIINFNSNDPEAGHKSKTKSRRKVKSKTKKNNAIAYSYVSKVDGVIKIHETWEECKERVHRVKKAIYKKSISKDDEDSIIADFQSR